ncbi:hypothetical protein GDO78_007226 [Eleutherodactylus coqui]|uniref:Ribonuclease A-domain domain-containing protein n=1 Tax=Eleutherodactylus coqui TaxID=57060 RepID=A0A8J6FFU2_ELECQ|nr:hypothetical protein GDO78_007226 [Eleutherodactylus coqui]
MLISQDTMVSSSWFLSIVAIFASIPSIQSQNYRTFLDKHIVEDNAKINCNMTIKDRNLNRDSCRIRNTFIHDSNAKKILDVCAPYESSTIVPSGRLLTLTDCKLLRSPSATTCSYSQTGVKGVVYVTCEKQRPVHFVKFEKGTEPDPEPTPKPGFAAQCAPCIWTLSLLVFLRELLQSISLFNM